MPDLPGTETRAEPLTSATADCLARLERYAGGVNMAISPRDHMFNTDPNPVNYHALGWTALDCIRLALLLAQKETVSSILDLPSGHGRVSRILRAEYPDARLTACDIDRDGVDFCARAFDAKPVYGHERPQEIELGDMFDLIWCGSLLTHMDGPRWEEFLELFESALMPGGVLLFSASGRCIAPRLRDPEFAQLYLDSDEGREAILRSYADTGFGYADYQLPDDFRESLSLPRNFGISLAAPSWVCSLIEQRTGLQLLAYLEGRWGAQDVIACVGVPEVREDPPRFRVPLGHWQDQLPAGQDPA
ncbi:MAG: class I SAM-dependent methyltransferase [Solirubrobacterales bacterium]